jgi:broad specificity phosphatase PhoE
MRFIFARHGESKANTARIISNRNDSFGLTAVGIQQAESLAERLKTEQIIHLYTSPILRAQQTSQILAEKLDVPVIVEDALRENDCGSLEGRGDETAWAIMIEHFQAWMQGTRRDIALAGGESFEDITKRFVPFVQSLILETSGQGGSLLLVSHGGVLYTMLPILLENVTHEFAGSRIMTNTSIIIADDREGKLICREWCGEKLLEGEPT